jgi:hypothetical protein
MFDVRGIWTIGVAKLERQTVKIADDSLQKVFEKS